eukprot:m.123782 g.123782  ORF g.123782 m.123782 type:complete len:930 (+) comp9335_c0_seq5:57-2846(+)
MPGILKVNVKAARDLPVMDNASQSTDAYVQIRLQDQSHKSSVCPKSLNPEWSDAYFRFEVDDEALQDETLIVKVWDRDAINDDSIGHVMIDLHALVKYDPVAEISGWFPLYDTLRGVRGSINLSVKLTLLRDQNRFRDTSCGVLFFMTKGLPECYQAAAVKGFVEELMVNDDPEHQWIDKVRTQRASNEARQVLLATMDGELRRKIGRKVLDLGGNAVVGYRQHFDLEGDSGLVARGIGTVVLLADRHPEYPRLITSGDLSRIEPAERQVSRGLLPVASPHVALVAHAAHVAGSPARDFSLGETSAVSISATSDAGSESPHMTKSVPMSAAQPAAFDRGLPLITMCSFPPGFVTRLGGVVIARSIKLLDNMENIDSPATRDVWWNEVRDEIRSQARSLGFNAIVGYHESSSLQDPLFLLTACGTAAMVNLDSRNGCALAGPPVIASRVRATSFTEQDDPLVLNLNPQLSSSIGVVDLLLPQSTPHCELFHLTFPSPTARICRCCNRGETIVPEFLICTVEPPPDIIVHGTASLVQARVSRQRSKSRSAEDAAVVVGEGMPYLEYALHSELINKMKLRGANALFDFRVQVSVSDLLTVAVATGTAVHLAALPLPPQLQALEEQGDQVSVDASVRERLLSFSKSFRDQLPPEEDVKVEDFLGQTAVDLADGVARVDSKKTLIVEMTDDIDGDAFTSLLDDPLPEGCFACSSATPPGLHNAGLTAGGNIQAITAVKRCVLDSKTLRADFPRVFEDMLKMLWYKLRTRRPAALCGLRYDTQIIDNLELQITLTGMAVRLLPIPKGLPSPSHLARLPGAADSGVEISVVDEIPRATVTRHLGTISLHMIKETTALRESGGLALFVSHFTADVLAIARAHAAARGGNAIVGYRIRTMQVVDQASKNAAQCLLSLCGDVVVVVYHDSPSSVFESVV